MHNWGLISCLGLDGNCHNHEILGACRIRIYVTPVDTAYVRNGMAETCNKFYSDE